MFQSIIRGLCFTALTLSFLPNALANDVAKQDARPAAALMLAQTCAGCHGTEGQTSYGALMPLAGLSKTQFTNAMQNFANGSRPASVMASISRSLTPQEIELMATYFASFPENPRMSKGDKS